MTDEQIIKALECCSMGSYPACRDCPYHDDYVNRGCINKRNADIKDLIIRQQKELEAKHAHILCLDKEIERLNIEIKAMRNAANSYKLHYETAGAEAINAYHEKVKKRCIKGGIYPAFVNRQMEDVRKEMVGE